MKHPICRLNNGLRVANFSSPHPFNFTTGEVLPACDPEVSRKLVLTVKEVESPNPNHPGVTDVEIHYGMSRAVQDALIELGHNPDVDVILVPLPVAEAVRTYLRAYDPGPRGFQICRVCRVADRVAKTIHPDRFCKV